MAESPSPTVLLELQDVLTAVDLTIDGMDSIEGCAKLYVGLSLALSYVDKDSLDMVFCDHEWITKVGILMTRILGRQTPLGRRRHEKCRTEIYGHLEYLLDQCSVINLEHSHPDDQHRVRWIVANVRSMIYRQDILNDSDCTITFRSQLMWLYDIHKFDDIATFWQIELPDDKAEAAAQLLTTLEQKLDNFDLNVQDTKDENADTENKNDNDDQDDEIESPSQCSRFKCIITVQDTKDDDADTSSEDDSSEDDSSKYDELEAYLQLLTTLEQNLGIGNSSLSGRYENVRQEFVVPKRYYKQLFEFALEECRERCKQKGLVPQKIPEMKWLDDNNISNESWCEYKGDGTSVITVNLARLLSLDKFEHLPAHEAYPGHHYMFTQVDEMLVKKKNWVEFSVVNTHSPYSFIAEGGAEWGAQSLLWGDRSSRFEFMIRLVEQLKTFAKSDDDTDYLVFVEKTYSRENLNLWIDISTIIEPLQSQWLHCKIASDLVDKKITLADAKTFDDELRMMRKDGNWPYAEENGFAVCDRMRALICNARSKLLLSGFAITVVDRWIKKEVQSRRCEHKVVKDEWEAFAKFAGKPVPPSYMMYENQIKSATTDN